MAVNNVYQSQYAKIAIKALTADTASYFSGSVSAALEILDEGSLLTPSVSSINFVGNGVTASAVGSAVTVNIPGGGSGGGTPGGSDSYIQYNSGGAYFGGSSNFRFIYPSASLLLGNSITIFGSGIYSLAHGLGVRPSASYQHVIGTYNQNVSRDGAFIVGGGYQTSPPFVATIRKNILVASSDGSGNGTVEITGSLETNGDVYFSNLADLGDNNIITFNTSTGQLGYTASSAIGGGGSAFPFSGNAVITGSLIVSGSSGGFSGITGSLFGTASWAYSASQAISSSYTLSSSYALSSSYSLSSSYAVTASYALNTNAKGPEYAIQFNSASIFSGSGDFRYNYLSQSLLLGKNVTGSAPFSLVVGVDSIARGVDNIGNVLQYATGAIALGHKVDGGYRFSLGTGYNTTASGMYSHTEGWSSFVDVSALGSHAEGDSTTVYGSYSHAEGKNTTTGGIIGLSVINPGYQPGTASLKSAFGDITGYFTIGNRLLFSRYNQIQPDGINIFITEPIATLIITDVNFSGGQTNVMVSDPTFDFDNVYGGYIVDIGPYQWNDVNSPPTLPGIIPNAGFGGNYKIGPTSAHAEGSSSVAYGNASHVEGLATKTFGSYAHAEGQNVVAFGEASHAEGSSSYAIGISSHAEGEATEAWADYSHTEGSLSKTLSLATGSHAEGYNTITIGQFSHAEGYCTTASSDFSHAEGFFTQAGLDNSGIYNGAHAEGGNTKALGSLSHAEGEYTMALGNGSHAEGIYATSSGLFSHAEGSSSVAFGIASHAGGLHTIASGNFATTLGQYNLHNNITDLFTIGDGTDDSNRHDLLNASLGYIQISGSLIVSGSSNTSSLSGLFIVKDNNASKAIIVDETNSIRVLYDNNETASLDWRAREAVDSIGLTSVDWEDRVLYDNQNPVTKSLDWDARQLYYSNGLSAINYSASNTISITGSLLVTQSYISKVDYIDFTPNKYDTVTPGITPTHVEGRLFYDTGSQTLCMYNNEADVTLNIGQESWLRARNQTGVTITNGSVVRINGAVGNRPSIALAQSTDQVQAFGTDNDIIGMATHDIEHGTDGFVTTFGLVNGVNTNAFNAGDLLWVSQSAGQYTNVAPSAPYDKTFVGVVTRKGPVNVGSIFITPTQPIHFHDISSVSQSGNYTQGDIWMFKASGSSGVWTNTKTLSGSYTLSGSLVTNGGVWVQTLTASFVSVSSGVTGSLFGTASWAYSASQALTASFIQTAQTASYVLQAVSASQALTASFVQTAQTASYILNAVSASFATTASFVPNTFIQNGNSFGATATLGTNDTQNLAFETNGTTRMLISSSGLVGIGTSTPSASLHISSSQENGTIIEASSSLVTSAALRVTQTGTGSALIIEDDTNPDGSAFIVRYDGRVGIGYANSVAGLANLVFPLNVNGTIFSTDFVATTGQANTITPKDNVDLNLSTRAVAATNINLKAGLSQFTRMIISGSGDVVIPSGSLTIAGNIIPSGPYVNNTSSYNLGSPTAAWNKIYVSNNSLHFVSGSVSASIGFNNGVISFNDATINVPAGSTVLTSSFATTSSYATVAQTLLGSVISASYAATASYIDGGTF